MTKKLLEEPEINLENIVGALGLGGAGTRVILSIYNGILPDGFGEGLAIDIDRNYPFLQNQFVDVRLIKSLGLITATGGIFTIAEKILSDIIKKRDESYDEETVNKLEAYLLGPAGKRFNIIFTPIGTGGGTGHGFLRSIINFYGKNIRSRFCPVGILPDSNSPPEEYLNSVAFFGMSNRMNRTLSFPSIIAVENEALKNLVGLMDLYYMNHLLGDCLRLLTVILTRSLRQGYSWGNIDRSFLSFHALDKLTITTFGISRNVRLRGIGENSIKKSLRNAFDNNLLGLHPANSHLHIKSNLKCIVFVNVPGGANSGLVKEIIQTEAPKIWYDNCQVEEVFVSIEKHITTIDLVTWFGGDIIPPILYQKIINNDKIMKDLEKRIRIFEKETSSFNNNTDILEETKKDFYEGYDYLYKR